MAIQLPIDQARRTFIRQAVVAGVSMYTVMSSNGVLAQWPTAQFGHADVEQMLRRLADDNTALLAGDLDLQIPELVENAAIVPVRVRSDELPVSRLAIVTDAQPTPLVASFRFPLRKNSRKQSQAEIPTQHRKRSGLFLSTRIRMQQSGNVVAIAEAEGQFYLQSRRVAVQNFECTASG